MTPCIMPPHMNFEGTRSHKSLAALSAFEGPVARVSPQMVSEMPLGSKSLLTTGNTAHEGLFT
jgi:hypothetical protein